MANNKRTSREKKKTTSNTQKKIQERKEKAAAITNTKTNTHPNARTHARTTCHQKKKKIQILNTLINKYQKEKKKKTRPDANQ